MTIDDRIKQIYEIWHSIEHDTRWDLGKIWLEKDKLEYMEARVEELEDKVLHLLKIIKELKHDRKELKKHMEHLLRLLHHVKPEREWQRDIKEELDEISREVHSAEGRVIDIARARMEARRQKITMPIQSTQYRQSESELTEIIVPLVTRKVFGDRMIENRVGTAYGKAEAYRQIHILLLKRIEFKGNIPKDLAFKIFSRLGILRDVEARLGIIRILGDMLELNINIDYGKLWPRTAIMINPSLQEQHSVMISHEINRIIPNVQLNIRRFEISINPIKVIVEATI